MPTRRLRALSAWSKARPVILERKLGAVGVLQPPALVAQVAEQLQHQRAGEPHGVEGVGAAHVVELALERGDLDRAGPAAVALLLRPPDLREQRDALAVGAHAGDRELGDQVLHQGIAAPSYDRNFPESSLRKVEMTLRKPCTDFSTESGACSPPMSVRTQPGLSATTMRPRGARLAA